MRVVIFGTGILGRKYLQETEHSVLFFVDNDVTRWGHTCESIRIKNPHVLLDTRVYDRVVIAIGTHEPVLHQLRMLGLPDDKIEVYRQYETEVRLTWLKDFAELVYERKLSGNVAEAGVYKGSFAAQINKLFPDRKLYLFDTFEGFDEKDIYQERNPSDVNFDFSDTSVDAVLNKMSIPENCIIKKGWFPDSAVGVDDEFCFVNLDMDLYQPTLEGLRFFYEKMVHGGVLLVHDFYSEKYPNVRIAVLDFEASLPKPLQMIPIGDALSVAILR